MGADGGTSATNRKYLRAAKSASNGPSRTDEENKRAEALTTCALSGAALVAPICADKLGRLYNKEAVLHFLLQDKAVRQADKQFSHIRKMKSVVVCHFTAASSPSSSSSSSSSSSASSSSASSSSTTTTTAPSAEETKEDQEEDPNALKVICPVTLRPMNQKNPFVIVWSSGQVYSAQAVRELPDACGLSANHTSIIIPLAPTATQLEALQLEVSNANKKRKRKHKGSASSSGGGGSSSSSNSSSSGGSSGGAAGGGGKSSSAAPKKKFRSAEELFTTGFCPLDWLRIYTYQRFPCRVRRIYSWVGSYDARDFLLSYRLDPANTRDGSLLPMLLYMLCCEKRMIKKFIKKLVPDFQIKNI